MKETMGVPKTGQVKPSVFPVLISSAPYILRKMYKIRTPFLAALLFHIVKSRNLMAITHNTGK